MCRALFVSMLLAMATGVAFASKDNRMQTQCFGRFEMQTPAGARVSQFEVSRGGVTLGSLQARSLSVMKAEWEKEVAVQRSRPQAKAGKALIDSTAPDSNTFMLSWYDSHASLRLTRIRVYHYFDNRALVLESNGPTETSQQRSVQLLAMRRSLLSKPSGEAGLCFDGGFFLAPDDGTAESVQVGIQLPGKNDVRLTLDTNTNNGELPERVTTRLANSGLDQEPAYAQVQKLFADQRTVNGIAGEAAGYKVPTTATTLAHRMVFQSLGVAQTAVLLPEITFTLKSGEQKDDATYPAPSLSDDEARRLFDDMVGSLKVRTHRR